MLGFLRPPARVAHGGRRSAAWLLVVAILIVAVLAGCGGARDQPQWWGTAYTESVGEPSLPSPATNGDPAFDLPEAGSGRAVVVLFGALRNSAVTGFLATLTRAVATLSDQRRHRLLLVVATSDADHDTLADLRRAVATVGLDAVGVRGTFPLTETAARGVEIDVEPVGPAGQYPVFGPQAVGFSRTGQAAVGWNLDVGRSALEHDLRRLTD